MASKTIVWITSYPKSGNTWVRLLVCNLAFGVQKSAAALNELAPDVHELGSALQPPSSPAFMKTHFCHSPALPLAQHTAGAVYVARDPGDVLLSNFHYAQRLGGALADPGRLEAYLESFLAARGDPRWVQKQMGTWDAHVHSWLGMQHDFPVLPLRYEDLLREPVRQAQRLCAFLGLAREPAEIERAVAGASFSSMRAIEERDIRAKNVGIFYKPYLQPSIDGGLRFMRSGQSGEAQRTLSRAQRLRMIETFGSTMRQLGYDTGLTAQVE
jgi:aryl sulfotransferase